MLGISLLRGEQRLIELTQRPGTEGAGSRRMRRLPAAAVRYVSKLHPIGVVRVSSLVSARLSLRLDGLKLAGFERGSSAQAIATPQSCVAKRERCRKPGRRRRNGGERALMAGPTPPTAAAADTTPRAHDGWMIRGSGTHMIRGESSPVNGKYPCEDRHRICSHHLPTLPPSSSDPRDTATGRSKRARDVCPVVDGASDSFDSTRLQLSIVHASRIDGRGDGTFAGETHCMHERTSDATIVVTDAAMSISPRLYCTQRARAPVHACMSLAGSLLRLQISSSINARLSVPSLVTGPDLRRRAIDDDAVLLIIHESVRNNSRSPVTGRTAQKIPRPAGRPPASACYGRLAVSPYLTPCDRTRTAATFSTARTFTQSHTPHQRGTDVTVTAPPQCLLDTFPTAPPSLAWLLLVLARLVTWRTRASDQRLPAATWRAGGVGFNRSTDRQASRARIKKTPAALLPAEMVAAAAKAIARETRHHARARAREREDTADGGDRRRSSFVGGDMMDQLSLVPYEAAGGGGEGAAGGKYKECMRNHAAAMGGQAFDGCGEYMPSSPPDSLKCAACGCHRSFHRRAAASCGGSGPPAFFRQPPPPAPTPALLPAPHLNYHPHHHQAALQGFLPSVPAAPAALPHLALPYHAVVPSAAAAPWLGARSGSETPPRADDFGVAGLGLGGSGSGSFGRKRFRTKFTPEQKERMREFAEKQGWRIQRNDDGALERFCDEIGVKRQVLKVWMHNHKHQLASNNNNSPASAAAAGGIGMGINTAGAGVDTGTGVTGDGEDDDDEDDTDDSPPRAAVSSPSPSPISPIEGGFLRTLPR
ncbi:hypothetical protein HU200_027281 [Digitaria exilis]|uniref:ZF-HD dimerization-type domain-containing protein n=1 Tax=Digitaria exilis TaxID=1010633 RepID=A0A835C756_9POAL|nr:hypothetical protein HU200_027281 [Digitaria exilis]